MRALRRSSSALVGWLADRAVPRPLRGLVYGGYCRWTGADPREAELALDDYPSLGAFFVRRLKPGARVLDPDPRALLSPCDGTLQALGRIEGGALLQAKGQSYTLRELLGAAEDEAALEDVRCAGDRDRSAGQREESAQDDRSSHGNSSATHLSGRPRAGA